VEPTVDFQQAQVYLDQALTFGIKPGLHRMTRLLELLGNPEREPGMHYIHIAGTNGKGSVSSYCASILSCAGHKVGVYTSPFLVRLTDRIRVIDGRAGLERLLADETAGEISKDDFVALLTRVRDAITQMLEEGYEHPTEFELITAVGFLYYAACGCDCVVLEVGLGGRLDSTNVIEKPLACIITALGYDHMDRLGSTLAEIAREKAGIIKAGCPVYLYDPAGPDLTPADADDALRVIRERCSELDAPLQIVRREEMTPVSYGWQGQSFTDETRGLTLETSLLGVFQPMNAALAARACLDLRLADPQSVRDGVRLARWPSRLEILRSNPPILLDGCHNPQGCLALASALSRLLPGKPVVFLAGMMRDKDVDTMLQAVLGGASYYPAAFVCTAPAGERGLPPAELADKVRQVARKLPKSAHSVYNVMNAIHVAATPAAAAKLALELADRQGMALCAFGSLYLTGSIRSDLSVQEARLWTGHS
jgi:dihydrofolate synthase / folylpolyglutamate synthase